MTNWKKLKIKADSGKNCFKMLALLAIVAIACTACGGTDDAQFQKGVERGVEDTLLWIYNTAGFYNDEMLLNGHTWDTKHFTATFTDKIVDGNKRLFYNLRLKGLTIGDCLENGEICFYIYAISNTNEVILKGDDCIWNSAIEYEGAIEDFEKGNTIYSSVKMPDNEDIQTMIIVIGIGGELYTATYEA